MDVVPLCNGRCAIRGYPKPVITHMFFLKMWKTKITSTRKPVLFGPMTMLNEPLQLFALKLPVKYIYIMYIGLYNIFCCQQLHECGWCKLGVWIIQFWGRMNWNIHCSINPLNPELNPICYLLALLAHHFLHVSRIRVTSLTLRLLMSYIYIWSAYSWCF